MGSGSRSRSSWLILGLILIAALIIAGVTHKQKPKKEITFASFNYSETALFGEIVKRIVEEKTDLKVNHIPNMEFGVAVAATQTGEVDMYLTYSGTQFTTVLQQEVTEEWTDPKKVLEYVEHVVDEEYDMLLMDPLGFDNTYAVAVRRILQKSIISARCQISKPYASNMVMATDSDFLHREEIMSYTNMTNVYDMEFGDALAMNYGLLYRAVEKGDVDAIVAYSSDGRIAAMDLKILEDDKEFFPPYDAMLIIRNKTIDEYPELFEVLDELSGRIDQDTIQALNARADVDGDELDDIAEDFLKEQGLI